MTKEIEFLIQTAAKEAQRLRHEYLSLEHLLYSVCLNEEGSRFIESHGGKVREIISALENYFREEASASPVQGNAVPELTLSFQRVVKRAVNNHETGSNLNSIGSIIASIMEENESYAAYLLELQSIRRSDVLKRVRGRRDSDFKQKTSPRQAPKADFPKRALTCLTDPNSIGSFDLLVGRDDDMNRLIHILGLKRKNNALLIGEPGVGKTCMVHGLAKRTLLGEVPQFLQQAQIYSLHIGSLLSGAKFRGDFEERFKNILEFVSGTPNAILFVDDMHTLVGSGSAGNDNPIDGANLIKQALSEGRFKCIGATTGKEHKKYLERNETLLRQFRAIEVGEPSPKETLQILKGVVPYYEQFHGVRFSTQILKEICELAAQYLTERAMPDKAIDVVDEVGVFVKLRSEKLGKPSSPKQSERINIRDVETVVSRLARVPLNRFQNQSKASHQVRSLRHLERQLKQSIFGQDHAVESVVAHIKMSKAGLHDSSKPVGSFLFTGPTGVGKTELCKVLAEAMGMSLLRIDMTEYMERHSVSRFVGAPPGYVGHDKGGLLTESVRKSPHSLVLLDEVEKAHPEVIQILLQVMDYGTLTDGEGRKTQFNNCLLVMTSNAGASELASNAMGFNSDKRENQSHLNAMAAVNKTFSPEFRNRLDSIIAFNYLNTDMMEQIIDKSVLEINKNLQSQNIRITLSKSAKTYLRKKGFDNLYGARPIKRLIQKEVKEVLTDDILFGELRKGGDVFFHAKASGMHYRIAKSKSASTRK